MHRTLRLSVAVLAVIALTAGCSSKDKKNDPGPSDTTTTTTDASSTTVGPSGSTSTRPADSGEAATGACAVVTKANLEAATGVALGNGKPGPETANTKSCTWQSADHNTNVNIVKYERAGDLVENFKASDANAKPVSGAGDEAYMDAAIGRVTMQIGEIGINISITPTPGEAKLITLARTVTAG